MRHNSIASELLWGAGHTCCEPRSPRGPLASEWLGKPFAVSPACAACSAVIMSMYPWTGSPPGPRWMPLPGPVPPGRALVLSATFTSGLVTILRWQRTLSGDSRLDRCVAYQQFLPW